MFDSLLAQLQDPMYELLLVLAVTCCYAGFKVLRREPSALLRFAYATGAIFRRQVGAAQLAQQSMSATITIVSAAFAVALVGYGVIQWHWTGTCSSNLSQIAAAEDLRFSRGYGYTANGNVTAAAFVDADGINDYLTVTPRDPAAARGVFYTFAAAVANGDWTYTVNCQGTHAGWSTLQFQGGATTKTKLQFIGPGGTVQAV